METITEQETGLVRILTESKLELSEAEVIKQSYLPYFIQISEIKKEAKKINWDMPTLLDEQIARRLRIWTMKIRTGSESVKDERKRIHQLKANIEQSAWNLIRDTCKLDEEKFSQVEKKREIEAEKRRQELKAERTLMLQPYSEFITLEFIDLANMGDADFEKLLSTAILSLQAKIEMEKKAEEDRIAKEKAEAKEQARIKAENERLKFIAEEKENQLAEERAKAELERKAIEEAAAEAASKAKADADAKLKAEKQANEKLQAEIKAKADAERKAAEAVAVKAKAEAEAKLKAEREAREKVELELKAKQEAEDKAKADEEARIEAEAAKGDKEKFADFINELKNLTTKFSFKSKKHKGNYHLACERINQLINHLTN